MAQVEEKSLQMTTLTCSPCYCHIDPAGIREVLIRVFLQNDSGVTSHTRGVFSSSHFKRLLTSQAERFFIKYGDAHSADCRGSISAQLSFWDVHTHLKCQRYQGLAQTAAHMVFQWLHQAHISWILPKLFTDGGRKKEKKERKKEARLKNQLPLARFWSHMSSFL